MKDWEKFEKDCVDYLNSDFGDYAVFERKGGSNSNDIDIQVITNSGNIFNMEAKKCPAQCGQFVLTPNLNTKKFEFSNKNFTKENEYTNRIIEYMNKDFDDFSVSGTSGKSIIIADEEELFIDWILDYYMKKKTKYFITNNRLLVECNMFKDYFKVDAKYRVKKSGSSDVGKKSIQKVRKYLMSLGFEKNAIFESQSKLYLYSEKDIDKEKFSIDGHEFMFSYRENLDKYEIRRLSNTFNANVIFNIDLIKRQGGISKKEFVNYLR